MYRHVITQVTVVRFGNYELHKMAVFISIVFRYTSTESLGEGETSVVVVVTLVKVAGAGGEGVQGPDGAEGTDEDEGLEGVVHTEGLASPVTVEALVHKGEGGGGLHEGHHRGADGVHVALGGSGWRGAGTGGIGLSGEEGEGRWGVIGDPYSM